MPNTIKYSDNPNEETAFVTQEDNTRTRAVLTTTLEGDVKFPDNPNSTKVSVNVDGVARKAVAVYNLNGGGGGGSDPHNLGYYADLTALQTAHPTGGDGDFAILGSTDTIWVWDSGTSAWVDADKKGQVTSVNNQTGDVTVQETLVSGTNIKTVDGNSLLGSGNLELSTYLTYPAGWTTTGTTKAFCDDIAADTSAVEGKAYLGEVTLSDLPASMANAEIVVEIMSGTTASNKVISLTCKSGNTAPYMWVYTYWNNGTDVSGWQGFATAAQGAKADTAVQPASLATVATSGLYSDLSGTPTIPAAIQVSTMPTAGVIEEGKIYQFVGATDANYTNGYFYKCVSDGQNPATYSWTRVDVQPTPDPLPSQTGQNGKFLTTNGTTASWGTVESLPSQTGQSGKFLTTDGTDASWSDKPLVNKATSTASLIIDNTPDPSGLNKGSTVAIGHNNSLGGSQSVAIGASTSVGGPGGVSIGYNCSAGSYAVAIGRMAKANANYAIQLGGDNATNNNTDANTFKVGNANGNFEIMSADGTIPTDRFTTTPVADGTYVPTVSISSGVATRSWTTPASAPVVPATTPTLVVADWSSNTQTITVQGVTASNVVLVSPAPASAADYASAGIVCVSQSANSLTFTCVTVPSNAITLNVVIF